MSADLAIKDWVANKAALELLDPVARFSAEDIADREQFAADEEFVRAEWLDMALAEIKRLRRQDVETVQ